MQLSDYQMVVFKDKADLSANLLSEFPGVHVLGAYERPSFDGKSVHLLSVKFSRVGKTSLERYPNLKTVLVRAHGVDIVDVALCRSLGIKVVSLSPHANSCAAWLYHKIPSDAKEICLFGNGSIGSILAKECECRTIDRSTPPGKVKEIVSKADVLISTLPLTSRTKGYFSKSLLGCVQLPVTIVSLSKGEVFDGKALWRFIRAGKLKAGHFDMLPAHNRDMFLGVDQLKCYNHTAWKFLPMQEAELAKMLKQKVDELLRC